MNSPQYSLRWNNYVNHVRDSFNLLRLENDLVDVTLCCDGGKIKAHKMLLSVCSNYFREIFKENPCKHPVIIFKNVMYDDLNAIINFMYYGEVSVCQEQLESFLITAELLEVKGLTDNTEDDVSNSQTYDNVSLDLSKQKAPDGVIIAGRANTEEPINLATIQTVKEQYIPEGNSNVNYVAIEESQNETEIPTNIDSLFSPETNNVNKPKLVNNANEEMQVDNNTSAEDLSDKNNTESDLVLKFRCHMCPKGFKHPTSLTLHKDSHAGKTQCPVCHRSFSRSYDMRSHLQRIHQGKQLTIKEIRYKGSNSDSVPPKQYTPPF